MVKRWLCYLAVLGCGIGLYVASPRWLTWILLLTVAALPLFSALLRIFGKTAWEYDSLGLFRFPMPMPPVVYEQVLRPYRPGDSLSRVHWKLTAKTGALIVGEEREVVASRVISMRQRVAVPIAVCLGVLLCIFPPGRYEQQMAALRKMLLRPVGQAAYMDLTAIGPVAQSKQAVLDVVASQSQVLYLRQQAFDIYDGRSWQSADWKDTYWPTGDSEGTVTIATRSVLPFRYAPYYIAGEGYAFTQGGLENADCLREYTYRQCSGGVAATKGSPSQCLQLPEETSVWARGVLEEVFAGADLTEMEKVEKIQNFVRNCAKYDTNTPQMWEDEVDFARWFVENGRGYCVHFATAAVVLLRCAGIPARLVTGFAVEVQAGVRKTVAEVDAHAWVEYLAGGIWRILEVTPTAAVVEIPPELSNTEILEERERTYGVVWVVLGMVMIALQMWLRSRRLRTHRAQLKLLAQKAAYSRYGLTPEEEKLFADLQKKIKGFPWEKALYAYSLFFGER